MTAATPGSRLQSGRQWTLEAIVAVAGNGQPALSRYTLDGHALGAGRELTPSERVSATVLTTTADGGRGNTVLKFRRRLVRSVPLGADGNSHDNIMALPNRPTSVICSRGSVFPGKHEAYASASIYIVGTEHGGASRARFIQMHAVVMAYAWLFAAPLAMAVARYFRHSKTWLFLHRVLAQSTIVGVSSGLFSLYTSKRNLAELVRFPHAILGFMVMVLSMSQSLLGFFTAWALRTTDPDRYVRTTRAWHQWLGRALLVCGLAQSWTGAEMALGLAYSWVVKSWIFFLVCAFAWAEARRRLCEMHMMDQNRHNIREALHKTCATRNMPTYTIKSFSEKCCLANNGCCAAAWRLMWRNGFAFTLGAALLRAQWVPTSRKNVG